MKIKNQIKNKLVLPSRKSSRKFSVIIDHTDLQYVERIRHRSQKRENWSQKWNFNFMDNLSGKSAENTLFWYSNHILAMKIFKLKRSHQICAICKNINFISYYAVVGAKPTVLNPQLWVLNPCKILAVNCVNCHRF